MGGAQPGKWEGVSPSSIQLRRVGCRATLVATGWGSSHLPAAGLAGAGPAAGWALAPPCGEPGINADLSWGRLAGGLTGGLIGGVEITTVKGRIGDKRKNSTRLRMVRQGLSGKGPVAHLDWTTDTIGPWAMAATPTAATHFRGRSRPGRIACTVPTSCQASVAV